MRKDGEQCEKHVTEPSFRTESHQGIMGQLLSYAGAFCLPTMVFFDARATEGTPYYCAVLDCKIPGLLLICITKWLGTGNDHSHCSTMPHAHVNSTLMMSSENLTANDDAIRVRHMGHAALVLAMTSSAHALHVHCAETQNFSHAACQESAPDRHWSAKASPHIYVKINHRHLQ